MAQIKLQSAPTLRGREKVGIGQKSKTKITKFYADCTFLDMKYDSIIFFFNVFTVS